jgi:glycolate oxidase iron-sulfur subunit
MERPGTAAELGRRKARNLLAAGADLIAAGNIGCLVQIGTHLPEDDGRPEVLHTLQILDRAYGRDPTGSSSTDRPSRQEIRQ